jgi:hypothetical protein
MTESPDNSLLKSILNMPHLTPEWFNAASLSLAPRNPLN